MTSQPGKETVAMHILSNISRSKSNQTMKYDQLIEYNKRNIFLKNYAENEAGRLVPDLYLYFKKALYEVKARELQLSFNYFDNTIKVNCIKLETIDSEICSTWIWSGNSFCTTFCV